MSTVFGLMIDLTSHCIEGTAAPNYGVQWAYCIVGIVLVGMGVSFEVVANIVTLAGEGLVQAVCMVSKIKFGTMKIICDSSFVVIALIISLACLHTVEGVREGTAAAAIFVGLCSKLFMHPVAFIAKKVFETDYRFPKKERKKHLSLPKHA
ncbi:integral membrane protein [Acidaminococcus sp. CAG:917]|nr:integral membrane protein [Acidaminococcus sp. CAG:917]